MIEYNLLLCYSRLHNDFTVALIKIYLKNDLSLALKAFIVKSKLKK